LGTGIYVCLVKAFVTLQLKEEVAVSAFWPTVPAMPTASSNLVPHLAARGEVDEGLGEAVITTIVLVVVVCLLPLAVILVRLSRRSRLVLFVGAFGVFVLNLVGVFHHGPSRKIEMLIHLAW
jgi:hypothetical protein